MSIEHSPARQRAQSSRIQHESIVTYTLREWCKLRRISVPTAYRLIKAGKLEVTQLTERRIGIRSDHGREYLDSCAREI